MDTKPSLKKSISYYAILLIIINSALGTDIFFLPSTGAILAGPASIAMWIVMAIVSVYIAMCIAELTSMFPTSGGVYEFSKQAFGRTPSFFIGWTVLITGYLTIAIQILWGIYYILPGIYDPNAMWYVIAIAIVFIVIFNFVAYLGMDTSSFMLATFGIITVVTVIGLAFPGLIEFNSANLIPFVATPITPIVASLFFMTQAFFGWENATFLAGETKDGEKVVPKALVNGTILIGVIIVLFSTATLLSVHWELFVEEYGEDMLAPLAAAAYGAQSVPFFNLLVYLTIIGTVASWIVSSPRLLLTLSEDKLFIRQLAHISPKYKTPSYAILFQTIVIIVLVIIGGPAFDAIYHVLIPLGMFLYSCILITLVVLRYKMPNAVRHYKAPFGKIGPFLVILFFLIITIAWTTTESTAEHLLWTSLWLILLGIPVFFLVELYNNPRFSRKLKDITAYYTLFFENYFIPKKVQEEILTYLGDMKGKVVLEYGTSVGTLTQHLVYGVGTKGRVVCINNSHTELKIVEKRINKPKWKTFERIQGALTLIHHPEYHAELHKDIPLQVDALVSIDTLSVLDEPEKILRELANLLPEHGRICFFDFGDFYRLIPNQHWLSHDEKIIDVFRKSGFSVRVQRKKGLFWNYIFIYGVKSNESIVMI